MIDLKKTVEVEGERYQIGRMDATDGSWVLGIVLTAMRNSMMSALMIAENAPQRPARATDDAEDTPKPETPEEQTVKAVRFAMMALDREETRKVHRVCLGCVSKLETVNGQDHIVPALMDSGEFAVSDLRYDVVAVMSLVAQTLIFNLTPFFRAGGLAAILR